MQLISSPLSAINEWEFAVFIVLFEVYMIKIEIYILWKLVYLIGDRVT